MARYNHFSKIQNQRIRFSELSIGDEFSFSDKPFRKCEKTGELSYFVLKAKETKQLFNNTAQVYIRNINK